MIGHGDPAIVQAKAAVARSGGLAIGPIIGPIEFRIAIAGTTGDTTTATSLGTIGITTGTTTGTIATIGGTTTGGTTITGTIRTTPNFNYWGYAAWPAVTGWVDYGWQQPIYYNYGDNVYYQDDQVYYGDQPVATAADYAQQAAAIALSQPAAAPAAEDWMPLGVFAVTTDGEPNDAEPTMFLQLAVSKQGVISGTFQNTATDTAQQIEGMIDKETQRAAWVPKGQAGPDHGNRHLEPDAGYDAGARSLRRWLDAAMADGAARQAEGGSATQTK